MTLDIRVGPGKALALYVKQLRKRERQDRERDDARRRLEVAKATLARQQAAVASLERQAGPDA